MSHSRTLDSLPTSKKLSDLSSKLIFKDGLNVKANPNIDKSTLLTKNALNVCKLLAIDLNDIL